MALSSAKKADVINDVSELVNSAKLTVFAKYSGTSVKSLQQLRRQAMADGTTVKIIKNRLFKKAIESNEKFKGVDLEFLTGQLLYAFNSSDEVAPAQNLAAFAKDEPQIEFIGGLNADGLILNASDIKTLASLPSKEQLRAQLAGTISAPLSGFVNVMSANVRGVVNVLSARADQLG